MWMQVMSFLMVCWPLPHWKGGMAGNGGVRVCAGCGTVLLCSVAITVLSGVRSAPKWWEQKPSNLGSSWFCFL